MTAQYTRTNLRAGYFTQETAMGRYERTVEWLARKKKDAVAGSTDQAATAGAKLDILISLVWPEALVHPEQMEGITNMIHSTLLSDRLIMGTSEVYREAREIATYLNSMT